MGTGIGAGSRRTTSYRERTRLAELTTKQKCLCHVSAIRIRVARMSVPTYLGAWQRQEKAHIRQRQHACMSLPACRAPEAPRTASPTRHASSTSLQLGQHQMFEFITITTTFVARAGHVYVQRRASCHRTTYEVHID